ncbi:Protein of unknown function (DUF760 [Striga hermonthica]|uniref:UV-B-induced protein At3g17800, chloroplastic-like n=1 Tax=Striga hermonthica TaxID=68872 RepID=A0A9N7NMA2_STRHE|nr:Protein of unknown function (DUF760 [Striga hermonthica]
METVAAFRASFSSLSADWPCNRSVPVRPDLSVGSRRVPSNALIQRRHSISPSKINNRTANLLSRKRTTIRACMQPSNSESSSAPIAPLQLESPIGQFLSEILVSHPHLVLAAVEQQLKQLQTDLDAEKEKEEPAASGTDLVLYRRIAEVKANERKRALEEILYALVVQKFMDAEVPMVPAIARSPPNNSVRVDTWHAPEDQKLERLHSPEAYEMIQNHLALILGNRLSDSSSVAQISKLRVGQVYAASIMYGYFLKRVDQRFQLEKTMKILPQGQGMVGGESLAEEVMMDETRPDDSPTHPEVSAWSGGVGNRGFVGLKPCRLRSYVMSFDGETLQRYATIRSKEAISIVEKHTEALFGRPEMIFTQDGNVDPSKDEQIKVTFGGLRRLVLEAVTFGSFLWDVESYVDSRYHFVTN